MLSLACNRNEINVQRIELIRKFKENNFVNFHIKCTETVISGVRLKKEEESSDNCRKLTQEFQISFPLK